MRIGIDLSPDLIALMAQQVAAAEKATSKAMQIAGGDLKSAWRQQVVSAGLGTRLGNTVRNLNFPKGQTSLRAASLVYTKAPRILSAFERGATIRSKSGFYLAIPTEAAGRAPGGRRFTPGEWERRRGIKLRFVYRPRGGSLLVAEKARLNTKGIAAISRSKTGRNQVTVPIFILVPQVRLNKRLRLMEAADAAISSVPRLIVANWIEDRL
jgi:hypothetical protein